jgi:hypothetical protein
MNYKRYLKPALTRALDEMLNTSPTEQLALFEELALIRDAAGQIVAGYSDIRERLDAQPDNEKLKEAAIMSGALMRDALKEVITACESAARVQATSKESVSAAHLNFFVEQIVQCAYQSFGDDVKVDEFIKRVRTQIRVPTNHVEGTTITPDADVIEMDETVPDEHQHSDA